MTKPDKLWLLSRKQNGESVSKKVRLQDLGYTDALNWSSGLLILMIIITYNLVHASEVARSLFSRSIWDWVFAQTTASKPKHPHLSLGKKKPKLPGK